MVRATAKRLPIIVLFEDDENTRAKRKEQIEKALRGSVRVVPFQDVALPGDKTRAFEDRLAHHLSSPEYNNGSIGLIVCDKALDRYGKLQVASETVVSAAARTLGTPTCLYERGGDRKGVSLKQRKPWEKGEIIIDEESGHFGLECAALYTGFQEIRRTLGNLPIAKFKKTTPADVLVSILKKPEEMDRIALYGAGEQEILSELMTYYTPHMPDNAKELKLRHYPRVLGNWLFSSILRFPGILADVNAAGSYLNISPDDLRDNRVVKRLFKNAEYRGPFAQDDTDWQWWWRRDLDVLLAKAGVSSGIELAKKAGIRNVHECLCYEGNDHPAGFLCMISHSPVCEEHSRGGISWFPGGADLARVSKREYEKIGPFLGLY